MSIKDRLSRKTEGLVVPNKSDAAAAPTPLRTSPGQMLMVNSLMKESNEKLAKLEAQLKDFEGTLPVRLIDANDVVPSRWANRDAQGFDTPEFAALREEIASGDGNVQPIKVRPLKDQAGKYEIVFGHRRHRACLELGKPVLAMVEEVSDTELFKEMDRENRSRLDLSPWEQGMMYRRALDEKLFSSQEQLARELGVDAGNVSKALKLAALDKVIVEAFKSPLDLQYRWAKPLLEASQRDSALVASRADELRKNGVGTLAPKDVYEYLIGAEPKQRDDVLLAVDGVVKGRLSRGKDEVMIRFEKGTLNDRRFEELREILNEWLGS
ncbi:ParB/RepB/Spo0J family partition protein [Noviherbaspirillum galbum]|uniref:ParB/RepB/Spo0J family partition protein n=1 Tax=Noviherbaspirillum galbum TaxID=2709383 RepID=A0A6B3STK3_9BURK|nr:ParB/RepB/Spo0J family partition protein [Noviherbaspirillum galbum]NEX63994.1 ParB/RepB/Spo0J family partition protein [Noviherbaspirillum galbum]